MSDTLDLPDMPPGVTFRLARMSDRLEISNMLDVYSGLDYVEYCYPHYMTDPNFIGYVLHVNGKLACFAATYILDDGDTVLLLAGRTSDEMQGQGYMVYMQKHLNAHLLTLPKTPQKNVYLAFDTESARKVINAVRTKQNLNYTVELQRQLQSYILTKRNVDRVTNSELFRSRIDRDLVFRPRRADFLAMMSDPDTLTRLFPDNQVVVFWHPHKLSRSNLERIYDTTSVFISTSEGKCQAVSFVTPTLCRRGFRYDMEFYGVSTNDMIQHLGQYFRYARDMTLHGDMALHMNLYFPLCVDTDAVSATMQQWGCVPGLWSQYKNYIAVDMGSNTIKAKI